MQGRVGHALMKDPWDARGLTVQLYLTQSSQKRLAENFLRRTTVIP